MIKLAMICTDEALEERLLNYLRGEKDVIISGFIVIRDVVHESDKGSDFMDKMVMMQPDIIILDMILLREAAALYLSPILEFAKKCASMRAIIIGDRFYEQNVVAMMRGGVRGFLPGKNLEADMIKCIHAVARGEIWLNAGLMSRVCDELIRECDKKHLLKPPTSNQLAIMKEAISRREMEVMALVSESMTNEEIAQKLFLSTKTVKTHIRNIFEKTGVRNRVEAALLYIRFKQKVGGS